MTMGPDPMRRMEWRSVRFGNEGCSWMIAHKYTTIAGFLQCTVRLDFLTRFSDEPADVPVSGYSGARPHNTGEAPRCSLAIIIVQLQGHCKASTPDHQTRRASASGGIDCCDANHCARNRERGGALASDLRATVRRKAANLSGMRRDHEHRRA